MFLNNRAAYKLAEEYALKKEAQNKSKPPASKKAPATSDVASSEFSAAKSTSTWLSERNASLRAEAIAKIQSVITKQNERKEDAMARIECLVEMGTARLGSNNKRGACLSMKKAVAIQSEIDQISVSVDALEKLFMDIASEDVKPEGYGVKVTAYLDFPVQTKTMNDTDLLQELSRLGLEETPKKVNAPDPVALGSLVSASQSVAGAKSA